MPEQDAKPRVHGQVPLGFQAVVAASKVERLKSTFRSVGPGCGPSKTAEHHVAVLP